MTLAASADNEQIQTEETVAESICSATAVDQLSFAVKIQLLAILV